MKITYFKSADAFRAWLERHHATKHELFVGFYRKDSGRSGLTYAEAVDEALCFGWIDGLKRRVDEFNYQHRFTPRTAKSIWSRINIQHAERLIETGRMTPAGRKAFAARDPKRSGVCSFENAPRQLPPDKASRFRADRAAWDFFQRQPPGYRRVATFWVVSAKKTETHTRRLEQLIADSRAGQRVKQLSAAK